jgi:hypothetical protein
MTITALCNSCKQGSYTQTMLHSEYLVVFGDLVYKIAVLATRGDLHDTIVK